MSDNENRKGGFGKDRKPTGERRYGKPASSGKTEGRKSYGKPAGASANGERHFGKPAGASANGERHFGKPAGASANGERRFAKPAGASVNGERRYAKPAGASANGERRFAKPAGASANGERRFAKPAGASANGERRFAKPAGASANGERRFAKPAGAGATGERRYARPVGGSRPFNRTDAPRTPASMSVGARRVALEVLQDVHERGAFAALALQDRLTKSKLQPADRRLATNIVYTTLENRIKIDYALDKYMDHPTNEPIQRDILRLSACQILFYDRVPDSAAVNEGVNLAKAMGFEGSAGFLNAVLRNLVRGKEEFVWPKREDGLRDYLHVMGSMPMWIVDRLTTDYGEEVAEQIIMTRDENHETVIRPNFMKYTDDAAFEELLAKKAWRWRKGVAPHSYLISGASEIHLDNDYRNGEFSIQGQSSMLSAEAVQVKAGMRVLDACAAPGGKSSYLAETMQQTGRVFAWELHEKRALLLESAKRRLKLENLRITVRDASEPRPDFDGTMDAVLLDAPCSGLGVLSQKPDLKFRLKEEDIPEIVKAQKKLLNTLCAYVKPGGTLVYSTCSILPEENFEQIKTFLSEHPDYSVEPLPLTYPEALRKQQTAYGLQLLAHRDGVEGFFIARLHRAR